ncbi:hypothetical protein ACTFIZ_005659 [Dictyostelium cf. discoideum]
MVQSENRDFIILFTVKIASILLVIFHIKSDSIGSIIVSKLFTYFFIKILEKSTYFKEENCIKNKNHIFYDLILTLFHAIFDIYTLENLYNCKKVKEVDLCDYEKLQIENQKIKKENLKKDKEIKELNNFLDSLVSKGILYVPKKKKIKNEIFFEY